MSKSKSKPPSGEYKHVSVNEHNDDDETHAAGVTEKENCVVPPQHEELEQEELISIDNAIERLGMGRFQTLILFASGLCFAADAMQVILLSFLTLVIQEEWDLSDEMTASITSCLFAGSMFGTLILGPLADSMGRRPVFLMAALIISVFGMGTAAASNYWILIAMIFMVGVGVGGLTVPFDILAEFLPSQGRGKNLLLIEYFWTVGCLFVVGVAYMTLHQDHWRWFVGICSLPCLLSLIVGYLFVPESARWLCAEGRTDEAMEILRKAAAMNGHDVDFCFPQALTLMVEEEEKEATLADLFAPKWREITLRLWGAWFAFAFGYYGVLLAITKVFATTSTNTQNMLATDTYVFDYSAIFLSSAAELVGTTLVILAVDRAGRISSQVVSYTMAGITVCALCVLASTGASRSLLISLGFAARVFEMGGTCVSWVMTVEVLTTEVRATGHSAANAIARIGAFISPFVVEGRTPLLQIGIIMLVVHLFTALCVSKLPETKGRGMSEASRRSGSESHEDHSDHNDAIALVSRVEDDHGIASGEVS